MKKLFVIVFLIAGMVINAQKKTMPELVSSAFNKKFENAQDVKFKVKKDKYRIRFKLNNHQMLAVFTKKGDWLLSETNMLKKELPKKVSTSINKKYPKGNWNKVLFVETPLKKYYSLSVDNPNAIFEIEVDENGKIFKTVKVDKPKDSPSPSVNKQNNTGFGEEGQ